jgi:hypothetical protein
MFTEENLKPLVPQRFERGMAYLQAMRSGAASNANRFQTRGEGAGSWVTLTGTR